MQNRLFQTNQKRLFDILEGKEKSDNITPNAEESKKQTVLGRDLGEGNQT